MSIVQELPEGWALATIADVATIESNLVDPSSYRNASHIAPNHIESGTGQLLDYTTIAEDKVFSAKHLFLRGHILYSKIRPYLAKAVVVDFSGLCSADMYPIAAGINVNYLHRWLISPAFTKAASECQGRTVLPKINQVALQKLEVPVPPLNEQHRIVAKIEALMERSRRAKAALDAIPPLLEQFRQSVLAAAFRGDLTADWRAKQKTEEIAGDLLKAIQVRRIKQAKTALMQKRLEEIYEHVEETDASSLPNGWMYASLDKLCDSFNYGTSDKSSTSGRIPVLRMGNIQAGEIDWSDLVFTSNKEEINKYYLSPGDVLFNRTNSPELVGKTAIYRGETPAVFAGYLIRIRNHKELDSEYLNYCLNSSYAKDYCLRVKSDGVSQSNINARKLGKFELPLCSLEEQKVIVCRVKSLLAIVGRLRGKYKETFIKLGNLNQSILAQAFRGELVPQDPNDEPASVLLERIQEECRKSEAAGGKKSGGKRRGRGQSGEQLSFAPETADGP